MERWWRKPRSDLHETELEVMSGLVAGQTDRTIAASLNISAHTVRSHIKNIFQKLGVGTKSQAVAAILRERIITE
jgi:DNA-binding CsgD family transcriptional regulator